MIPTKIATLPETSPDPRVQAFPSAIEGYLMAKALSRFTIQPADDGYTLHIEDDSGETLELTATAEQLDIIAEAIEDQLEEDVEEIDVVN